MESLRNRWLTYVEGLQNTICRALEQTDEKATFQEDLWQRPGGGGGKTRVLSSGGVFEKAGVNTSAVEGAVTEVMKTQLNIAGSHWFACGLSLVLHPLNPYIPTTHANWRYFELYDADGKIQDQWFGGGADLTPYYLFEEDARHFHTSLKRALDPFGRELYPAFKDKCDQYFNNAHRGFEMRGIGGIFYDHLRPSATIDSETLFHLQQASADSFLGAYLPLVEKRRLLPYGSREKYWQEIRRGRYVEFNLIHDRGTLFGLKTGGRTESILMSLPPTVRFDYHYEPEAGSPEAWLLEACRHPKHWAEET